MFENTKEVIGSRRLKKIIQYNCQMKMGKGQIKITVIDNKNPKQDRSQGKHYSNITTA
jgi:hypothetical protein